GEGAARASMLAAAPLDRLEDPGELALLRRVAPFPRPVGGAAVAPAAPPLALFLYDLASGFPAPGDRREDGVTFRFIIQNDRQMTMARLALVEGVVTVLASGLGLLGVEAPDEMR